MKRRIPDETRRVVATRYGCEPGWTLLGAPCYWCGRPGVIVWHRLAGGRPSAWVTFEHELDHLLPEIDGGDGHPENIVLACRSCNRRRRFRRLTRWSGLPAHLILTEPLTTRSVNDSRKVRERLTTPSLPRARACAGADQGIKGSRDQVGHLTE